MSNLVFGSQEQRIFAQYAPTSFQITGQLVPQGPGTVVSMNVVVVPATVTNNFDDSFVWGANGIVVLKAGIYSISYDVRCSGPSVGDDYLAETWISVTDANDDPLSEIRYCRSGFRSVAKDANTLAVSCTSGTICTFLPYGYQVRIRLENWLINEPVQVLGSSKLEVIRLL